MALIRSILTTALNPIASYRIVSCLFLSFKYIAHSNLSSSRLPPCAEILATSKLFRLEVTILPFGTCAVKHHVSVPTRIGSILPSAPPSTTFPHPYQAIIHSSTPTLLQSVVCKHVSLCSLGKSVASWSEFPRCRCSIDVIR